MKKNIIVISVVVLLLVFLYRSCTKGYDNYGYVVQARDKVVFQSTLSNSDPNIVEHGRKRLEDIRNMDQEIDNGDGSESGLVRWYVCSGIDCDEGWRNSFKDRRQSRVTPEDKAKGMDTIEQKKIEEYRRYDPGTVQSDVERDIQKQSIKLFYADLYEAPEIIDIKTDPNQLPPHTPVYLGIGCLDPSNAEDGSTAYRSALASALLYGRQYNQAMARHLKLDLKSDDTRRFNSTQKFIRQHTSRGRNVKIELSDIQPLFGGRHISLDGGSGQLVVQTVRPGGQGLEQRSYVFILGEEEVDKLVALFVKHDFLSLSNTDKTGVPDQAKPKITLENAMGNTHSVWNWSPPVREGDTSTDKRFHAIYRGLLRMETKATETMEPFNTSPYKG